MKSPLPPLIAWQKAAQIKSGGYSCSGDQSATQKLTRTNSCSLSSTDPLQGQSRLKKASQKSTLEQEVEYECTYSLSWI